MPTAATLSALEIEVNTVTENTVGPAVLLHLWPQGALYHRGAGSIYANRITTRTGTDVVRTIQSNTLRPMGFSKAVSLAFHRFCALNCQGSSNPHHFPSLWSGYWSEWGPGESCGFKFKDLVLRKKNSNVYGEWLLPLTSWPLPSTAQLLPPTLCFTYTSYTLHICNYGAVGMSPVNSSFRIAHLYIMPVIPALESLKQDNFKLKARLVTKWHSVSKIIIIIKCKKEGGAQTDSLKCFLHMWFYRIHRICRSLSEYNSAL